MAPSQVEAAVLQPGALVEHLKCLSHMRNRFQRHAEASLRVLKRRARREHLEQLRLACAGAQEVPTLASTARASRRAAATGDEAEGTPSSCTGSTATNNGSYPDDVSEVEEAPHTCGDAPVPPTGEASPMAGLPPPSASEPCLKSPRMGLQRLTQVSSLPLLALPAASDFWSEEIISLLRTDLTTSTSIRTDHEQGLATEGLRLHFGSFQIPHPRKVASGGEDSLFISRSAGAAGVADGVGEWEWRFGLNPRAFADELMGGARHFAEGAGALADRATVESAVEALDAGYQRSASYGSATGLVAMIDKAGTEVGIANLGDSGFRQVRRPTTISGDPQTMSTRVVNRTKEQQHSFNCPFQLSRLPEPGDFERLLRQGSPGLRKLVRAVQNTPANKRDLPVDADCYTFKLQEGDLMVLGTDGLFDNVHDHELCQLVDLALSPADVGHSFDDVTGRLTGEGSTEPDKIAEAIAKAAFLRSEDSSAKTPFGQNARDAGLHHTGGKMDDISVVVAWAVKAK